LCCTQAELRCRRNCVGRDTKIALGTTGKPLHRSGPSSANVPIITWPPERTARKTRST
jgi:hypothetical protein